MSTIISVFGGHFTMFTVAVSNVISFFGGMIVLAILILIQKDKMNDSEN